MLGARVGAPSESETGDILKSLFSSAAITDGSKLGTFDGFSLEPGDADGLKVGGRTISFSASMTVGPGEGCKVGNSIIPLSILITVPPAEGNSLGCELGTSEDMLLGPGDADGDIVGNSTIPSFNTVGKVDGVSLGITEGPSLGPGDADGAKVGTSPVLSS